MSRRVVITGLGLLTPLGIGREAFETNLFDGVSGIAPFQESGADNQPSRLAGQVTDFDPNDFVSPRTLRRMDRLSQMVTAATKLALDDAGIDPKNSDTQRLGMVMGTAFGATDVAARYAATLFTDGPRLVNPILVPNTVMNAPAGHAAIEFGLRGINTTFNHREASAETAIAYAAMQIAMGRADALLTGGGETLSPFFLAVLDRFRAISPQADGEEGARPFDKNRNGPVAGEGVGLLCVESLESALARKATIYAEITGWGMASAPAPANDWPEQPDGMVAAMNQALTMANLAPADVDTVFAAASGGIRSDALEARALEAVFDAGHPPAVTAPKGALGESFSSGGMRTAALALALTGNRVPPTLGLEKPDIGLDVVIGDCRQQPIRSGLVNACSSGGTFASLVLKKAT